MITKKSGEIMGYLYSELKTGVVNLMHPRSSSSAKKTETSNGT